MVLLTASGGVNNIAAKYFPCQITPHGENLFISEEIKILIFVKWGKKPHQQQKRNHWYLHLLLLLKPCNNYI